jgi:hypothetical protein
MTGATSQDRERCQFLFWLMKNPMFAGRLGRRAVGRRAKGSLGRRSVELRASGAISLHWQAVFGCQDGLSQDIANTVRALDRSRP